MWKIITADNRLYQRVAGLPERGDPALGLLAAYPEKAQAIIDGTISTRPWAYYPVIFSDGTAFAFWGADSLYHRSQLLLHRDDPLS
jgi:hypothetical protein